MSDKIKSLVDQIKKMANDELGPSIPSLPPDINPSQSVTPSVTPAPTDKSPSKLAPSIPNLPPETPDATTPRAKTPSANTPDQIAQMQKGNQQVKSMQKAMIKFANTVANDVYYSNLPLKNPNDVRKQKATKQNPGVVSFLDFFAHNFLGHLPEKFRGQEYQSEPGTRTEKQRTATSAYTMKAVVDTIMRVGGQANELQEDGVWRWRTQNALKNIAGFSLALLQLSRELNISNPGIYTFDDWRSFQSNLKAIDRQYQFNNERILEMPIQLKQKNAIQMKQFISKIERLYTFLRQKILTDARTLFFIEGQRPLYTFEQKTTQEKDKKEKEESIYTDQLNNKGIVFLPDKYYINYTKGDKTYNAASHIPFDALKSKEAYFDWMEKHGVMESVAIKILENIKKQLDSST